MYSTNKENEELTSSSVTANKMVTSEKIETGSYEGFYRVRHENEVSIVKIPVSVFHEPSLTLVKRYIDFNTRLTAALGNADYEANPSLRRMRIIPMEAILFSPEEGTIEATDLITDQTEVEANKGLVYGIKMPDLTLEPDAIAVTIIDPDFLYNPEGLAEKVSNAGLQTYITQNSEEIFTVLRDLHRFMEAAEIRKHPILEHVFQLRVIQKRDGSYNWELIPLDYTNAQQWGNEEREREAEAFRRESEAENKAIREIGSGRINAAFRIRSILDNSSE